MIRQLRDVLNGSDVAEQQGAFAVLATNASADADALVEEWLDRLSAGKAPPELALDVLEAAAASKSERVKRRLAGYEGARPKDDLRRFREALAGGDAEVGRQLCSSPRQRPSASAATSSTARAARSAHRSTGSASRLASTS